MIILPVFEKIDSIPAGVYHATAGKNNDFLFLSQKPRAIPNNE
jgi:hypothetical protein